MCTIDPDALSDYRARHFRTWTGMHLQNVDEAVAFVEERGFIYFWPIKDILMPSLWVAVAGNRPVADEHDDPGHVTWGWKDSLLGQRRWYYAKVLRKRATIISLQLAPYFYALTENYGSPEEDYLTQYEQGRLTLEAKSVYEALLDHGAMDTVALRKAAHLTSNKSEGLFNKALSDLQADFKIVPVAVTQAGAWHYAFAYDLVARHYPEIPEQAHAIRENQAQQKLAELYLRSVGAAQPRDLVKLFGWRLPAVERTLNDLARQGNLRRGLAIENRPGEWIAIPELVVEES